jgi:hypothetical protein
MLDGDLRNELLAPAMLEWGYPFSIAELLAPVGMEPAGSVFSYELLAPLSNAGLKHDSRAAIRVCGVKSEAA